MTTPTFTARCPEDVLAVVPVVLGFVPTDSVAMLTFGAGHQFHARVDLPPPDAPPQAVAGLVDALLAPAVQHDVGRVVFVVYSVAAPPADRVVRRLVRAFRGAGIEVVDALRADGARWWPLLHGRRAGAPGVPYDAASHPFAAQAVLEGRVTHDSREALAATLLPDPDRVAALEAARPSAPPEGPGWVRATTTRLTDARESPDDEVAARLLQAIGADLAARDAAWCGVPRARALRHVDLWSDLHRRAPEDLAAGAAAVLALHAWLSGQGALAWCGVDRARRLDPDHTLAGLVGDLLQRAVPPDRWEERWERLIGPGASAAAG